MLRGEAMTGDTTPQPPMFLRGSEAAPDDLSLRELARWAEGQARHIAAKFGLGPSGGGDQAFFALAQAVKLGEEVGELHAEILGTLSYQRPDKSGGYSTETLGGELADVLVCLTILAHTLDVDLVRAVGKKIGELDRRRAADELARLSQDPGLY
jgi:NTP pyrophosphatase (non-canonical NTP hydrolase)